MAAQIVFRYWPIGLRQLADLFEAYPFPVFVLWFVIPKLIVLNLTQALLTGMACRCFGGRVRGFGLVWWIVPLFQADLGNSLAFMDRRGRLTMIWLGLLSPVFIGAASIVAGSSHPPGSGLGLMSLSLSFPPVCSYPLSLQYFSRTPVSIWLCATRSRVGISLPSRAETQSWLEQHPAPQTAL